MQTDSPGQSPGSKDRNAIPILVVRLGPARDFVIAIGVFALVILAAAAIAFVMFG